MPYILWVAAHVQQVQHILCILGVCRISVAVLHVEALPKQSLDDTVVVVPKLAELIQVGYAEHWIVELPRGILVDHLDGTLTDVHGATALHQGDVVAFGLH